MRRRSGVAPRRVIFVGVEGKSDRAFAQLLGHLCEEARLHLHLDIKLGTGGDSVSVVEDAGRRLARHPGRPHIVRQLVLLDRDRIEADLRNGRDARAVATRWRLDLVLQDPNLEGLLLRLHRGYEQRRPEAKDTLAELRRVWRDYSKPPTADELIRRFSLADLGRAARYDEESRRLLAILGLPA